MNDEEATAVERVRDVHHLRILLVFVGVLGMMWTLGVGGAAASHGGFEHGCIVEGPFRSSPPHALSMDGGPERAYLSLWPFGRACDWKRSDGPGVVTALPDWTQTGVFLACATMAIVGGFVIGRNKEGARSVEANAST